MHINILSRKALYVFLSLAIIAAPTMQANAASGWTISSSVSSGSRAIVTASKAGYKGAVNIAPTAGRLALKLGKGANWAALAYTAIQLAPDLADIQSFQPDYANNRVKYDIPAITGRVYIIGSTNEKTPDLACRSYTARLGYSYIRTELQYGDTHACYFTIPGDSYPYRTLFSGSNVTTPKKTEYISIPAAAEKMIDNAKNGHGLSQAAISETAAEMVAAGDFDADLLSGAVPINDSRPLVPAVPGSQNGNSGYGDDLMTGGDIAAATEAALAAAEAAKKSAAAATAAAAGAADDARRAADEAKDLINSAVDQAIKDAAKSAADAAAQVAKDAADVANVAKDKAKDAAKDAANKADDHVKSLEKERAKELAKERDTSLPVSERTAARDRAKALEDEIAKAKETAKTAEKEATKAKEEAAKPFELPAFCTWAKVVCDYTEWVKAESVTMKEWLKTEAVPLEDENLEIDETMPDGWIDKANAGYVSFQSQCPNDVEIPINYMGVSQNIKLSYIPFCSFASLIKPAVILGAWISGLLIISGGRGRE